MYKLNKDSINRLLPLAQNGCQKSVEKILESFMPYVLEISRSIWYQIYDETSFEQECYRKIINAIKKYRIGIGKQSFVDYTLWRIGEVKRDHLKRRKRSEIDYLDAKCGDFDIGKAGGGYEVEDSSINLERDVLGNEKITFLAEGDFRKKAVLKAWCCGFYDSKDISLFLAEQYGGNAESHRKFITRFKTKLTREFTPHSLSS